jgi:hypothetical protein
MGPNQRSRMGRRILLVCCEESALVDSQHIIVTAITTGVQTLKAQRQFALGVGVCIGS